MRKINRLEIMNRINWMKIHILMSITAMTVYVIDGISSTDLLLTLILLQLIFNNKN